jgi:transposase
MTVLGRKEKGEPRCPGTHPPYPPKYRRQILELARAKRKIEGLAREFLHSANVIRKWAEQEALDEGLRSDA